MIETVPPGTILYGHYRIERVLGSGGFGHVYLASNLTSSQQCAVKEYLVTGASGQEQLKHEATVLSQLHHPSLPAFQDAFMERGRYYVVLNYIEGNDLTDLIRMTRQRNEVVPIERILQWLISICEAVTFLHNQYPPVIHRDIKPDNIRITSSGTAILVDLGNAKAAADGARTLFFIRHQGTPGYAPQEQYPGGSGTDTRSDVYALGGTLYFALTTHEPPSVSTRNQAIQNKKPDLPTLQELLANNPPEEKPDVGGRQFRVGSNRPARTAPRHSRHIAQLGAMPPDLLKQLNRIIQRAMAMQSKDRYQSVADLSQDLKKVINAFPAPQQPSGAARDVDPHSTQPDLPMLYEALQAAKEQANTQGSLDNKAQRPTAPSTTQCPRCNTPVSPQATYCPRCGSSLFPQTNSPQTGPSTGSTGSQADMGDQTMIVNPQVMAQQIANHAQKSNAQRGNAGSPAHYQAQQTSTRPAGHGSTATQAPPSLQTPSNSGTNRQNSPAPTQNQGQSTNRSFLAIGPRTIILLIAILLLLIILGVFLLTQGHLG
ncbi:MAG TPA: serine/threonine-protein kinase [Ktedonobacteraceae bacterium]|jgi:serine/threonine protein kinase|nr:serine/threonine-protein kinase [Ktedonobacteraceae bacterium]